MTTIDTAPKTSAPAQDDAPASPPNPLHFGDDFVMQPMAITHYTTSREINPQFAMPNADDGWEQGIKLTLHLTVAVPSDPTALVEAITSANTYLDAQLDWAMRLFANRLQLPVKAQPYEAVRSSAIAPTLPQVVKVWMQREDSVPITSKYYRSKVASGFSLDVTPDTDIDALLYQLWVLLGVDIEAKRAKLLTKTDVVRDWEGILGVQFASEPRAEIEAVVNEDKPKRFKVGDWIMKPDGSKRRITEVNEQNELYYMRPRIGGGFNELDVETEWLYFDDADNCILLDGEHDPD